MGVPLNFPVELLKLLHAGMLATLKVSVLPFASVAVGVKEYSDPAVAVVAGLPEIVSGVAVVDVVTVMEKAGNFETEVPSDAPMMMLAYVPAWAAVGVPLNLPVAVLKVAHDGGFWMLNCSALPLLSEAVGVKE